MEKRYGFFGGSFNPVTNAHLNLATLIAEKYSLDKVVFVPMGDKYKKQGLASEKDRYEMLKLATRNEEKLEVSNIELNLPYALTMLQAFKKIQTEYNDVKPYFIIGADNLNKLINLPDFEILARNYEYILIKRNDIQIDEKIASNPILKCFKDHFNILEENPYEQISSTKVRELIDNEILVLNDMIPNDVYEYIVNKKVYKTNMKR